MDIKSCHTRLLAATVVITPGPIPASRVVLARAAETLAAVAPSPAPSRRAAAGEAASNSRDP
jgi:hypothetical protein